MVKNGGTIISGLTRMEPVTTRSISFYKCNVLCVQMFVIVTVIFPYEIRITIIIIIDM